MIISLYNRKNHGTRPHIALLCMLVLLTVMLTGCGSRTSDQENSTDSGLQAGDSGQNADDSAQDPDNAGQNDATASQPGTSPLPELKDPISSSNFLLNTIVSITLYDRGTEGTIQECFDLVREYEAMLSRTIDTSEISRINQAGGQTVTVSRETADLLQLALYYSEISDGAFDLTIAPLSSLWDFTSLEPVRPTDAAIQAALPHVDYHNVTIDGTEVTLSDPEAGIDLGAIAKGYIADRLKDYLLEQGVQSAIINLGGNVLCVGSKPDGSGFKVGIQKPFENRNETISILELHDMSIVSSGIYERCFREEDGTLYHHLLDPATGYPYESDLVSVTILSKGSADGDGLSTTCFSLGLEKGMELINSLPDTWAVFITEDYELHFSEGFEENIKIIE